VAPDLLSHAKGEAFVIIGVSYTVGEAALAQPTGSPTRPGDLDRTLQKVVPPRGFKVCGVTPKAAMAHKI